jgi:hypothetical protein
MKKSPVCNTVYTSCGFQSYLRALSSLVRAVTVDSEVATSSRTLHILNVMWQLYRHADNEQKN